MSQSFIKKRIGDWDVLGQTEYVNLINSVDNYKSYTEQICEQIVIQSVPVLILISPSVNTIRLYTHHLNYELFLKHHNLLDNEQKEHLNHILSFRENINITEIEKCRKFNFPNFFDDVYWIHAMDDTYFYMDNFTKKLNRYIPSLFEIISNYQLGLIAKYDSLRIHLLKFLSLLPSLDFDKTGEIVIDNLLESLDSCIKAKDLPNYLIRILSWVKRIITIPSSRISAKIIRYVVRKMATRFVIDEKNSEASLNKIFKTNRCVTLDRLGELVLSEQEADKYCEDVQNVIRNLSSKIPLGSTNDAGILNSHVSIKVSALCSQFRAEAFEFTYERVAPRLRKIFDTAIRNETFINIDAEHYEYRDCVFRIFKKILTEEYTSWKHVGIVVQCYLRDSYTHIQDVKELAESRQINMPIRLVKGAYWDAETIQNEVQGHTAFQFLNKEETDICFRQCIAYCFDNHHHLQICVGSHNFLDHLFVEQMWSVSRPHAPRPEHQCLHKTHEALSMTMAKNNWVVREYLPIGDLIDGMAYLVRRIMENSSQKGVLNMMRSHKKEDIKIKPTTALYSKKKNKKIIYDETLSFTDDFVNVPPVRLFIDDERTAIDEALNKFEVGSVQKMTQKQLNDSMQNLSDKNKKWSEVSKLERSQILVEVANKLLIRRTEFAVYITKETNKTISESLADVDEAIDFLNYYARQELELNKNAQPRGTFAIIAPWNFPLAIPCGMTIASLVAGNVTFLKSSEKSHFVAEKFVQLMYECGIPKYALVHVTGDRTLGDLLLSNKQIAGCVFTGSKKVGGDIIKKLSSRIITNNDVSYQTKIIAETGGKNTIIVTQTADMDEAVSGVLYSAFAHAGQKCSACSRVIVHSNIKKTFLNRLKNAIESIKVGDAKDYATFVNPIVNETEVKRLIEVQQKIYDAVTKRRIGKVLVYDKDSVDVVKPMLIELDQKNALKGDAYFNTELFGPILHVTEYQEIEEALEIFNNNEYALTGGIFSQSPNELARLDWFFDCGNVYINRNITGARVGIEPFGGYKASGTGPKAGGDTYLDSFHINIEPNQVWTRFDDKVIEKPGQVGYKERKYSKNICVILNKNMSEFAKNCIQELVFRGQRFDVLCVDEESKHDMEKAVESMDRQEIHEFIDHIKDENTYEIFLIGNEIYSDILENITNKMNVNDTLPIIISKYDHLPSKSFSDLFYYTRTYAINTMKHGANLK